MKNKILVTGSSGFVGQNLIPYLSNNKNSIIGITRKPKKNEISYSDLDNDNLNTSKAIVHLAGKAHDLKKTSKDEEYFEVNTELTKTLFNQFLESECAVFIYMSSVKAAADLVEGVLTEDVTPNPVTVYGKSKLAAENYILSKEIPSTKKVFILRPCMIHGPGNKGNLNLLYSLVSKSIPYPFGSYKNKRSFVSIDNLCFIIEKLLEKEELKSNIFNVSDDLPLSTNEVVGIISKTLRKKIKIINVPKSIIKKIAKIGNYIPIFINEERVEKLTENYVVSNKKIKISLNIENLPTSATLGLQKTISSFINK